MGGSTQCPPQQLPFMYSACDHLYFSSPNPNGLNTSVKILRQAQICSFSEHERSWPVPAVNFMKSSPSLFTNHHLHPHVAWYLSGSIASTSASSSRTSHFASIEALERQRKFITAWAVKRWSNVVAVQNNNGADMLPPTIASHNYKTTFRFQPRLKKQAAIMAWDCFSRGPHAFVVQEAAAKG